MGQVFGRPAKVCPLPPPRIFLADADLLGQLVPLPMPAINNLGVGFLGAACPVAIDPPPECGWGLNAAGWPSNNLL